MVCYNNFSPECIIRPFSYIFKPQILIIKLLLLSFMGIGDGARILAPFFSPTPSHYMMTNAIIRELVKRGHEVTFITPFSLAKENLGPNYREILLHHYDSWEDGKSVQYLKNINSNIFFHSFCKDEYKIGAGYD